MSHETGIFVLFTVVSPGPEQYLKLEDLQSALEASDLVPSVSGRGSSYALRKMLALRIGLLKLPRV